MIKSNFAFILTTLIVFSISSSAIAKKKLPGPSYTNPDKTDADFPFQGEYTGKAWGKEMGVQVIALGNGEFHLLTFKGGLPGDGWEKTEKSSFDGTREGDVVTFENLEIKENAVHFGEYKFEKVNRKSSTLGAKPPEGAVVLFDGSNADEFKNGRMSEDKLLMEGCRSKKLFGSHKLHLEFRLPYEPIRRGQQRANSGMYIQGRYEVQILDSFGLEGKDNECGGIYKVGAPDQNMCYPPLTWQTYDVDFTAAKYDDDGKLVVKPRITVKHNGVVIHDNLELPGEVGTTAAPVKAGPENGPLYLQDHNNPVRFRNIWVIETK